MLTQHLTSKHVNTCQTSCRNSSNTARRLLFMDPWSFSDLSKTTFTQIYCAIDRYTKSTSPRKPMLTTWTGISASAAAGQETYTISVAFYHRKHRLLVTQLAIYNYVLQIKTVMSSSETSVCQQFYRVLHPVGTMIISALL